jgi:hypothetical protein
MGTLIGYLSAKSEQILAYYFGSSKSSDHKTELLAKAPSVGKNGSVNAPEKLQQFFHLGQGHGFTVGPVRGIFHDPSECRALFFIFYLTEELQQFGFPIR